MSSDNGIYIVQFPHGYRVIHAQAIDNVSFFTPGSKEYKDELRRYFGSSKVYPTEKEVLIAAVRLEEEFDYYRK
jgi:hypothetical protein